MDLALVWCKRVTGKYHGTTYGLALNCFDFYPPSLFSQSKDIIVDRKCKPLNSYVNRKLEEKSPRLVLNV